MKHRNRFLIAIFSALLLGFTASGIFVPIASAQTVDQYIVTSPTLTWNDLSTSGGNEIYGEVFYYTYTSAQLPFDFQYDNTTIPAGTTIYIGGGNLRFGNAPAYGDGNGGLGNSGYNSDLVYWGGPYITAGSGQNQGRPNDYGIYTQTTGSGSSQVFTIQLTNVHTNWGSGNDPSEQSSIQVKLFQATGIIQFLYQYHDQNLGGYYAESIGLNGTGSPSFVDYTYAVNQTSTPSTDIQFSPVPPIPPPQLSLQPKSITFGALPVGFSETSTAVTATNVGKMPLTIQSYSLSGSSDFTVVSGPATAILDSNQSVQYTFQFAPTSGVSRNGFFTLYTDGKDSGIQVVNLTGNGLAPNVSFGVNTLFHRTFTPLGDTSPVQYIPITNIGNYPLIFNSAYLIGLDASDYFITRLPANPIPPDVTDSIGIRFAPRLEGVPDARIVISTNALNTPWDTIQMYGTGILQRLVIDSAYSNRVTLNFDSVSVGTQVCQPVLLYNPGSDTLKILKNFFASADYDFSFMPLTGTDTLIAPGATEVMTVCFKPLKRGYRTADLQFVTGIPPTFDSPPLDTSDFVLTLIGTGVPTGNFQITGPDQVDTVEVGSGESITVCQTDTLWNLGGADLTVTSLTISGPDSAEFSPDFPRLPFILAAGTHDTFTVCSTPTGVGDRIALLTGIASTGEKLDTGLLGLDVFGVSACTSDSIATNLPPLTCVGDTSFATVMITNCGNITTSYRASITGPNAADYSIVGSATSPSESAGGSATFTVAFAPTTNTTETATLNIVGGTNPTIALSGVGGEATIAGTGTAALTQVGTSDTFIAIVTNNGTCDWTPGVPTLPAGSMFNYVSGGTTSIPPSGSDTLTFIFTPTSVGNFSDPVGFPSSIGASSSTVVTLNGTSQSSSVADVSSDGYSLEQNYPNPFAGKSAVEMTLPVGGVVNLAIVDVTGKLVQTVLNQRMAAGTFEVTLDASNLASGTYYYQMTAGTVTLMRQMMVIK